MSLFVVRTVLRNIQVTPSSPTLTRVTGEETITLTCTVEGNPLPRLSWTVNDIPSSNGVQAVTGFMETASSTLTLSVGELTLGLNSIICTASVDPSLTVQSIYSFSTLKVHQLQVVSTETNQVLNASNIVVGTASDLALQVRCQSFSDSSTITWMNGTGSVMSQGLSAFGVSQENGVLRVYPVTMLSEGVDTFYCTDGTNTLTVQFDIRK